MNRFFVLVVGFLLVLSALVLGATNIQVSVDEGVDALTVVYPKVLVLEKDAGFLFNFDVLDSNFSKVSNASAYCNFYATESNGSMVVADNLTYNGVHRTWFFDFNSSYTCDWGEHNFYVWCYDSSLDQSGFVSYSFKITDGGVDVDLSDNMWVFVILLFVILGVVFLLLGRYFSSVVFSFAGALLFLVTGVYLVSYGIPTINNYMLESGVGWCVCLLGAYLIVRVGLEYVEESEG